MDKSQTLKHSAAKAIAERDAERKTLARKQAQLFIHDGAHFDPMMLRRLGKSGLQDFLITVRDHNIATPKQQKISAPEKNLPLKLPPGWADQRRAEPCWWLRAAINGFIAGLVPIFMGCVFFFISDIH
jgi:hypothetical protein